MGEQFIKFLLEQLLKPFALESIKTGNPIDLPLKIKIPSGLSSRIVTVSITTRYTMASKEKKDTPSYKRHDFNWGGKPNAYSNDKVTIRQPDGSVNAYYIPKKVAEYISYLRNTMDNINYETEKEWWENDKS